jgi:hypothetical protein
MRALVRSFPIIASTVLAFALMAAAANAQVPEVGVVVEVGHTATLSVTDFQPRKHVRVWLLERPG